MSGRQVVSHTTPPELLPLCSYVGDMKVDEKEEDDEECSICMAALKSAGGPSLKAVVLYMLSWRGCQLHRALLP